MIQTQSLPTPHPSLLIPIPSRTDASKGTLSAFQFSNPDAARKAYHEKKLAWAKLPLRQDFADASWMRGHIKEAGLRSPIATDHRPYFIRHSLLSLDGLRKFLDRSDKPLARVLLTRIDAVFSRA